MADTADLSFSQAALGTYQICPLRFRYRYLDDLYWSALWGTDPADRAAAERGQTFHLIARRYYAGLAPGLPPEDPVEPSDHSRWLTYLQAFLPHRPGPAYYPELELRLDRPGLRLQARFDLLVVEPGGRATIYDWKTEARPARRTYFRQSMQTLLYRFLLCAAGGAYSPTGAFAPEQVAMVYWFAQRPERWERFEYTAAEYARDERFVRELIAQISRTPREQFLATTEPKVCERCEYRSICHGRRAEHVDLDEEEWLHEATLAWDDLPELPG